MTSETEFQLARDDMEALMRKIRERGKRDGIGRSTVRDVINGVLGYDVARAERVERALVDNRKLATVNQYYYRIMPDGQSLLGDFEDDE